MMRWYAVHTRPAAEARAAENLDRQGYVTYLPRHRRWVRHARRRALALRPLFPRYLFVGIDRASMSWRPVRSTIGVAGIVCGGDEPLAGAQDVVDALRRRERDGAFDEIAPARRLAAGDDVRLSEGPLADFVGRLACAGADQRVVILFEFLGRIVRAEVPAAAVEAA
jgi:transcriptional antiterminator RfaH